MGEKKGGRGMRGCFATTKRPRFNAPQSAGTPTPYDFQLLCRPTAPTLSNTLLNLFFCFFILLTVKPSNHTQCQKQDKKRVKSTRDKPTFVFSIFIIFFIFFFLTHLKNWKISGILYVLLYHV